MRATAWPAEHSRGRPAWSALRSASPAGGLDIAWAGLCLGCLAAILALPSWQLLPYVAIWICLAGRCGARPCPVGRALGLAGAAAAVGTAVIGWEVARGAVPRPALAEGPLLAAMFAAMLWAQRHGRGADGWRPPRSGQARLLADQRRFLEDTSHQLRGPITIALGHAELLAGELSGKQGRRDIDVVVGELERLRLLSDRLLLIAASENPEFLRPAPVELDMLAADRLLRWQPAAPRCWALGRLDPVLAQADAERLRLALDALLENAVQHTVPGDAITVSVTSVPGSRQAAISVDDTGEGIRGEDIPHIFDRFTTTGSSARGTGLGLALVQAIARGHAGEVRVRSTPGTGSRFELLLPVRPSAAAHSHPPAAAAVTPRDGRAADVSEEREGHAGD